MNKTMSLARYIMPCMAVATYLFLYIPIVILVLFSFNKAELPFVWQGFTTSWYKLLFSSLEIWIALKNTLVVALSSVCLSLLLGTLFVYWSQYSRLQRLTTLFYTGIALPEIVMAVGLLSLFSFFSIRLGPLTLIAGHTLLGLAFVIPLVRARLLELDYRLIEASLDLGASQRQTFFNIILPLLKPALLASGLLVFILSLDDFLIAFFCAGTYQTLSLYIFGLIKLGVSPLINALSTILLAVSSALVVLFCSIKLSDRVF
jgi:spermidine/putrescine transport system permease protein